MVGLCIAITSIAIVVWFLEKGMKIIKIRVVRWKADEGWSNERCYDYTTTWYQIIIRRETGNWN